MRPEMLKFYYNTAPNPMKVALLLEELGLPYELETFQLGDKKMRAPEYLAVHPLGRVPVLEDDDGTRVLESGAIVQYVLAKYAAGRLAPLPSSPDFAPYLQWLHYAEGMLMPPVNIIVVETILLPAERRNQVNVDRAVKLLGRLLEAVDAHLEGREFLAGDFSGADIMTGHASIVAARLGADIADKPNLRAYIERLQARPALQAAWNA